MWIDKRSPSPQEASNKNGQIFLTSLMADLKHRCSSEGIWLAAVNKKTTPTLERNSYVERRTVTQSNREGESWAKDWVAPLVDSVNVGGGPSRVNPSTVHDMCTIILVLVNYEATPLDGLLDVVRSLAEWYVLCFNVMKWKSESMVQYFMCHNWTLLSIKLYCLLCSSLCKGWLIIADKRHEEEKSSLEKLPLNPSDQSPAYWSL